MLQRVTLKPLPGHPLTDALPGMLGSSCCYFEKESHLIEMRYPIVVVVFTLSLVFLQMAMDRAALSYDHAGLNDS